MGGDISNVADALQTELQQWFRKYTALELLATIHWC